jgi:multidrug transporter EmrE-like cation transporter
VWSCITIVASIMLGYILYGEAISSKKMLGALLAIIAIWCVN